MRVTSHRLRETLNNATSLKGGLDMFEIKMKLDKRTKGALRYREVDEEGNVLSMQDAKIGTLYVRKGAFHSEPESLTVSVTEG